MKLSNLFKSAAAAPKSQPRPAMAQPARQGPPMNFEQTKAYLAALTPKQLEHAHQAALARATPNRIPLTILALAGMHRTAEYNGKPYVTLLNHYDNAETFVRNRASVSNIGHVIRHATKDDAPVDFEKLMRPKKRVNWAPSVVDPKPSAEFLARARRKAHS